MSARPPKARFATPRTPGCYQLLHAYPDKIGPMQILRVATEEGNVTVAWLSQDRITAHLGVFNDTGVRVDQLKRQADLQSWPALEGSPSAVDDWVRQVALLRRRTNDRCHA